MTTSDSPSPARTGQADFQTTHWSLVAAAGQDDSAARQALAELCERYWYPLYAYVRRRTPDVHEAQDLTQAFFAHLLDRKAVAVADRERGRFRSFLLASLRNFLANEHERAAAAKRGGGRPVVSLDFDEGESRLKLEPVDELTPERLFERQWTLTLLDDVVRRLEAELTSAGKGDQFRVLKPFLAGPSNDQPYGSAAAELGMTEEAVRQAVHRLRKRYRELLRAAVAETLDASEDVDDEIQRLIASLSG
jgi:RNA polymerase sigma factor (sigma-70 family)